MIDVIYKDLCEWSGTPEEIVEAIPSEHFDKHFESYELATKKYIEAIRDAKNKLDK